MSAYRNRPTRRLEIVPWEDEIETMDDMRLRDADPEFFSLQMGTHEGAYNLTEEPAIYPE